MRTSMSDHATSSCARHATFSTYLTSNVQIILDRLLVLELPVSFCLVGCNSDQKIREKPGPKVKVGAAKIERGIVQSKKDKQ